jgi:hypothetical protein
VPTFVRGTSCFGSVTQSANRLSFVSSSRPVVTRSKRPTGTYRKADAAGVLDDRIPGRAGLQGEHREDSVRVAQSPDTMKEEFTLAVHRDVGRRRWHTPLRRHSTSDIPHSTDHTFNR